MEFGFLLRSNRDYSFIGVQSGKPYVCVTSEIEDYILEVGQALQIQYLSVAERIVKRFPIISNFGGNSGFHLKGRLPTPLSELLKDEITILWLKLNERRLIREGHGKERKRTTHPVKAGITAKEKDKETWLSNLRILILDSDETNALLSGNLTESLKNLKLLSLSRNSLQSLSGIANMRKLKILAAEGNNLRSFNEVVRELLRLEYLYLSHNEISAPLAQSDINNLFAIREIDLSYNKLELLPGELLLLPSLEILDVSHNNLHVLSLSRMRHRPLTKRLQFLDLSYNKLVVFPEKLVEVAVKLDIGHNLLRKLSELTMAKIASVWHSVQAREDLKFEIHFDKNPLLVPPLTVALGGVTEITKYFFKLNIGLEEFFGTKIICFGEVGCGKTSLLLSLSSGQRRVTDASQEKTEFSEIHHIAHEISRKRLEKYSNIIDHEKDSNEMFLPLVSFNILAWDFSGNTYYEGLASFFTTSSLISLICVNLQSYKDAVSSFSLEDSNKDAPSASTFYSCVGQWIDLMLSRTNGVTAVIVATKCDLVERSLVPGLISQLQKDVHMYVNYRMMKITDEIQRLEEMPRITSTTKCQLEYLYSIYKSFAIAIHPEIVITSCVGSADFHSELTTLCDVILKLTETLKDVFPFILHVIPPGWIKVAHFFEEPSQNEPTAIDTNNMRLLTELGNFKSILHHRFQIKPESALSIATYLHESGKGFLLRTAYTNDETAALRTLIPMHQACHSYSFITSLESLVECLEYLLTPDLSYLLTNTANKLEGLTFKQKIFRQKLKRSIISSADSQHIRKLFDGTSHALETGCIPGSILPHIFEACGIAPAISGFYTIRSMFLIIWQWLEIGYPIKNRDTAEDVRSECLSIEDCLSNYATPYSLAVAADILRPREETEEFMAESPEQNQSPTPAMHTVAKPDWLASNGLPGLCFPMRLTKSRSIETEQLWASAADALGSTLCLAYRFPNGLTPGVLSRALVRLHWPEYVKFYYLSQWKDGTLMVSQDGAFLLQVTKQEKPEEEEDAVLLELRSRQLLGADLETTLEAAGRGHEHEPANAFDLQLESAQLMWQHLTPVAKVFESTLLSYKGLWFRRGLRCFHCREITFAHGWVEEPKTKWNQNRKCQACGQKTPICFLTSLLSGKLDNDAFNDASETSGHRSRLQRPKQSRPEVRRRPPADIREFREIRLL